MKKIIFHGGFQKTGSTAVQRRVMQNIGLVEDTIYYLGKRQARDLKTWSQRLIKHKDKQKTKKLVNAINDVLNDFEGSGLPTMLISNEILFGNDLYNEQGNMLEWIELVLPCFADAFANYDAKYVFYTRPEEKWLKSTYNQSVLMRQYTVSYQEYADALPFDLDWTKILRRIQTIVPAGSARFIDMAEDISDDLGLGAALLRMTGLDDKTISQMLLAPKANVSLNDSALEVMRFANASGWPKPRLSLFGNLLKDIQDIDLEKYPTPDHPDVQATLDLIVSYAKNHIHDYAPDGFECRDKTSIEILKTAGDVNFAETQIALLKVILGVVEAFHPTDYGDDVSKVVRFAGRDITMAIRRTIAPEHMIGKNTQKKVEAEKARPAPAPLPVSDLKIAIATCVKNEGPFLLEWIAYNRAIGVTDFIFYSNDCTDGTAELLDCLADRGIVEHYPNPSTNEKYQMAGLRDAKKKDSFKQADWKYVCDVDEFLNVKVGDGTIAALIDACASPDIISVCMAMYANDGIEEYEDIPVMQQFLRRNHERAWNGEDDIAVKSLTRRRLPVKRYGAHRPFLNLEKVNNVNWVNGSGDQVSPSFVEGKKGTRLRLPTNGAHDLATLNHYTLRSTQSYMVKSDRGDVNSPNRKFDDSYWDDRNDNEVLDDSILRMKPHFDVAMAELMADKKIAALHADCVEKHLKRIGELGG